MRNCDYSVSGPWYDMDLNQKEKYSRAVPASEQGHHYRELGHSVLISTCGLQISTVRQTSRVSVPSNDHHSLRITSSAASTNRILTYSAGRGWDIPTFEADTSQCNPSRHIFLFLVPSLLIQTQLKSCWRWAPDFLECVMCRGGPPVGPSE